MATNTTHYNLEKPAQSDLYNVDVFNDNADKIDTALWGKSDASNLAVVEPTNTASQPYSVGQYLVLGGILYKVTAAIASGGTIIPGTNVDQDTVGTELKSLKDALSKITINVSNMTVQRYNAENRIDLIFNVGASEYFSLVATPSNFIFQHSVNGATTNLWIK